MPAWRYCMSMIKYLPVLISIEKTSNSDQTPNSVCRKATPQLQGTSTMLHCCLQTLILALAAIFCVPVPMFLCIVESLGFVSMLEVWLVCHKSSWQPLLTRLLQTVHVCTRVPLLDIFQLRREVCMMCLSSAAGSFFGRPLCLRSSTFAVSLCCFKRAWIAHLKTPVCLDISAWGTPCLCSNYLVSCCCHDVKSLWARQNDANSDSFRSQQNKGEVVQLGRWDRGWQNYQSTLLLHCRVCVPFSFSGISTVHHVRPCISNK